MTATARDVDEPVRFDLPEGQRACRLRRLTSTIAGVVLTVVVALAVLEAVAKAPVYGVTSRTDAASGHGFTLDVHYGRLVRGSLPSALEITVSAAEGFTDDVRVAITSSYFDLFRTTGISPEPMTSTASGGTFLWTFEHPKGRTLVVEFQNEAVPLGWFAQRTARVAVVDADGRTLVSTHVTTALRP